MRREGVGFGCAALLFLAAGVQATLEHPLSTLPPSVDFVQTVTWFPQGNGKEFEAGKPVPVILGIRNNGDDPVNISAIGGSINSPYDFNFYVQNFTFAEYYVELLPGHEVSVDYTIFPAAQLTPREFIMALTVFYRKVGFHSTTFFNATVEITEPKAWIDSQLLFLVLLGAAGVALTGYILYSYLADTEFFKRANKRPRVKVEVKKTDNNPEEWLKGTAHDQFTRAKAKRAESLNKKAT